MNSVLSSGPELFIDTFTLARPSRSACFQNCQAVSYPLQVFHCPIDIVSPATIWDGSWASGSHNLGSGCQQHHFFSLFHPSRTLTRAGIHFLPRRMCQQLPSLRVL